MKMGLKETGPKKRPVSQKKIDSQFAGDLEETVENAMGEKLKKIKEFENKFKERWAFEGDSEFYFSVCFKSKDERDEFLRKHKISLREGQYVFADELPESAVGK